MKKTFKITAITLIIALLMQSLSICVFAVGTEEQNTTDNTEISEKAEETKPYILFEDEEKRTETEKHFKMSDGSYTVADYGTPIHFKQQNQWIDYDNNMNSFEENEEKIEKQSLQNNFNSIIDNKINESINVDKSEDNKYFKSIKTDTDIMLSKKSKHNNMIKMEKDGYKISWGFQNIKRKNIEFTNIQENYATKDEKYLNLKNSKKEAFYKDVFDNVDLQYFVLPKKIKENIIIKNANAQNEFLINYSIDKLTPIQKDDKTIELIDENEKVIYTIFAPIMTDSKGESSQNVTLSIFSVKNKKMVVKLAFDKAWITDENRVFPINVDPIIETEQASEKIKYTYSNNLSPNTSWNHDYYLYIGNNSQGKCRSYVNIALPQLPASSVITNANLSLYYFNDGYSYDPGTTTKSPKIEVREIGQDKNLSMSQITWNNQPDANFNNPVLDYKNLYASSDQWFTFDVTKSINKWYSNSPGENHKGFMLKSSEENDSRRIRLLSSNTAITNKAYPIITINYLDSTGIESYGSYHEQSVGRAGTGYINDLTGNLTFTAPVVQTPGTIMPANLSFVYNGYNSDKYFNNNVGWILLNGAGWQISATRFVENVNMSIGGITYKYALTDGDGTKIYFISKDNGTYFEDENGLGYKITETTVDGKKVCELKFKDGTKEKYKFLSSSYNIGYLIEEYDIHQNKITYNYDSNNTLIGISAPGNETLTFEKDSNTITKVKLNESKKGSSDNLQTTSFVYGSTSSGKVLLQKIIYPDGKFVEYTYENNKLKRVYDIDRGYIEYTYSSSSNQSIKNRVVKVESFSKNSNNNDYVKTSSMNIIYNDDNSTTFEYDKNLDGYVNYGDDFVETYTFNTVGQLINVTSDDGGSAYKYKTNTEIKDKDKVTETVGSGKFVNNYLYNSSAEKTNNSWVSSKWQSTTDASFSFDSSTSYLGNNSLKVSQTNTAPTVVGYRQTITPADGVSNGTYTFSAYVKTDGKLSGANGEGAKIFVAYFNASGVHTTTAYSSTVVETNGWERISLTFNVSIQDLSKIDVYVGLTSCSGAAWFDCMQLEEDDTMSDYTLLTDANFRFNFVDGSNTWESYLIDQSELINDFSGEYTKNKYVAQKININKANVCFSLSGTAQANSVKTDNERKFAIELGVSYVGDSGVTEWHTINFNHNTSAEQRITGGVVPKIKDKVINYVYYYMIYYKNANSVMFSYPMINIDETGSTYTYDDKGNVISSNDYARKNQAMQFDNANSLTEYKDEDSNIYKYTYDSAKEKVLKSAYSKQTNVGFYYYYDANGHLKKTTMGKTYADGTLNSSISSISSSTEYSTSGNYVAKSIDQRSNETLYNYNEYNGLLNSITDPNGNKTNYSYNKNSLALESVSGTGSAGLVTNRYEYDSNYQLTGITKNMSLRYLFDYDQFGNVTNTKINTYGMYPDVNLSSNTYNSKTQNLEKVTYGNGKTINYSYDKYDRVTEKKAGSTSLYAYKYNNNGQLYSVTDKAGSSSIAKKYEYQYDLSGRITSRSLDGVKQISYNYDILNRPVKIRYGFDGQTFQTTHEYGMDNRKGVSTLVNGTTIGRHYDNLSREEIQNINVSANMLRTNTEYVQAPGVNKTTTLISGYDTGLAAGTSSSNALFVSKLRYEYQYDNNGNISKKTTKKDGAVIEVKRYIYDGLNQLKKEINDTTKQEITYTYNIDGNIATVSTDPNPEDNEVAVTVQNYTYGNSSWKDQLTKFGNQAITYDAIGNPLTYRNAMSFTWKNGREMDTATVNGKTSRYYYNSDGIRTTKYVGTLKTDYLVDDSGRIIGQESSDDKKMLFMYDMDGAIIGMMYKSTADGVYNTYYYVKNAQGDIVGITDKLGVLKYTYEYDSWGKLLNIVNASTGAVLAPTTENYATLNPFRYRGYYYDNETGLYYLDSRYYDPITKRFVNSDTIEIVIDTSSGVTDKNLYSYCDNNPVVRYDTGGEFWETVFDVVTLVVSVSDVIQNPSDPVSWIALVADAVDLIPFVTGVGETVRAVKTTKKVVKKAENSIDVATSALHRPYIRKSVRAEVEKSAKKLADGRFVDFNTKQPINGKYDLGHKRGKEFKTEREKAMKKGWSQKQFNDHMNNPKFYQIESPSSNRSHKYEKQLTRMEKRLSR